MEAESKERVAILGGGAGGLAAAWRLSEPGWRDRFESITVYERGWRLGGKGASSRGAHGRIEEHGLHIWLGYYENAFRLIREVYEELDRPTHRPQAPIRTWTDAFKPVNDIGLEDLGAGHWDHWVATFSANDLVPGQDDAATGPMGVSEFVRRALVLLTDFYGSLEAGTVAPGRVTLSSSPVPPGRGAQAEVARSGRLLVASALAAAIQVVSVLRSGPTPLASGLPGLERFGATLDALHEWLRRLVVRDDAARRLWSLADLIVTTVRGILVDGLLTDPRGFAAINDEEYRGWITRHGASEETLDSALVRGVYDLVFGFQDGDPERPRFAAGLGVFLSGKLFFEYKGSIFWKLQAGMGDVVFAPLYEALSARGVGFRFWSQVDALRLSADGSAIARVEMTRLYSAPPGSPDYQPLIEVGGLPCFPAAPELNGPTDALPDAGSIWSAGGDGQAIVLEQGRDFDRIVFAIPIGMVPYVCSDLIEANPRWRSMVDHVGTVATQVFQLWLTADLGELGWSRPGVTMTGFGKPFETWSAMEHLLAVEQWPAGDQPQTLAYFCSTLPTAGLAERDDPEYPKRENERVRENAVTFLRDRVGHFWPGAVDEHSGFRWELLAGASDRVGEDRFDSQFWRANIDPSDRYVLSLPGSDQHRLRTDQSGYRNMVLAGDWIDSGLNAGCMEAAVMSGLEAANTVLGRPLTDRIAGYYLNWGK
ncbi:MAG TPA: FAD-dependent oxidoreductase [Acidimicrobiia bacterium]|nr:FAD-dependent oxidoreductase [Acidimicrobiia bacterium]